MGSPVLYRDFNSMHDSGCHGNGKEKINLRFSKTLASFEISLAKYFRSICFFCGFFLLFVLRMSCLFLVAILR